MSRSSATIFILLVLFISIAQPPMALAMPAIKGALLKELKFVKGTINTRTRADFKAGSNVVLGIPGGPGIPGKYMDQMTADLAKKIGAIPMVVDLPNHGSSKRLNYDGSISYPEARVMLQSLLRELSHSGTTIYLFGHSLGALIALDLLHSETVPIAKTILVGMPIEYENNPDFTKFLSDSDAPDFTDEPGFAAWWRAVLPAYFYSQPTQQEIDLLAHSTSWFANEHFTSGLPPASVTAAALKPELMKDIIYIEGEKEIIIPRDNFRRIGDVLPMVPKSTVPRTGHFPMLENSQEFLMAVTAHLNHATNCSSQLRP